MVPVWCCAIIPTLKLGQKLLIELCWLGMGRHLVIRNTCFVLAWSDIDGHAVWWRGSAVCAEEMAKLNFWSSLPLVFSNLFFLSLVALDLRGYLVVVRAAVRPREPCVWMYCVSSKSNEDSDQGVHNLFGDSRNSTCKYWAHHIIQMTIPNAMPRWGTWWRGWSSCSWRGSCWPLTSPAASPSWWRRCRPRPAGWGSNFYFWKWEILNNLHKFLKSAVVESLEEKECV